MNSTNHERLTHIQQFLTDHFGSDYRMESLAGDASFRRYHRIYHQGDSYLLMDAPPSKESVEQFINVAHVFAQAVNVPQILKQDIQAGLLLLQDFGQIEFAHKINDGDNHALYQQAIATLNDLQGLDIDDASIRSVLADYDADKLQDEMALFWDWFLPFVGVDTPPFVDIWQNFTHAIVEAISHQPKVVVHRDYHSRNLMIDKASDRLGVIDFQDALIGAYTYDLVSLVRDAYIDFDELWVDTQLQNAYTQMHIAQRFNKSLSDFMFDVNVMGIQRHLKVLGIFIRLSQRDGKDRYLANIPKVMNDLHQELQWLCVNSANAHQRTVFDIFYTWLCQTVMPAYTNKFQALGQ